MKNNSGFLKNEDKGVLGKNSFSKLLRIKHGKGVKEITCLISRLSCVVVVEGINKNCQNLREQLGI